MAFPGSAADQVAVLEWSTATASSTPLAGTAVSVAKHGKFLVVFRLGDMASETIDCAVETCDSNGANNVALKEATQLAAHASNNDSKVIVIGVEANQVAASGKSYIRGKITTGNTVGGTCTIAVFGLEPRNGPASGGDNAAVVEVKP
jgi:hypothetical protein